MPFRIFKPISRFLTNRSGAFAPMFAMGFVGIISVIGISIQYSSLSKDTSTLQNMIDAAVLAGAATEGDDEAKIEAAKAFMEANTELSFEGAYHNAIFKIKDGKVIGHAALKTENYFIPFIKKVTKVEVDASAAFGQPKDFEISVVLDFSDSMGSDNKLENMKAVVTDFLTNLEDLQKYSKIRVALTPFAALTGISIPRKFVLSTPVYEDYDGDPTDNKYTGCTGDRKYPYNSDGSPAKSGVEDTKYGGNSGGYYLDNPAECKTLFMDTNLIAVPLTKKLDDLKDKLDAMQLSALTHLSLGMDIGWQMLSPDGPFGKGVPYSNTKTEKYLVFLTDGAQSAPAFGPGNGPGTVAQGWLNLTAMCTAMKAKGVQVATVAYDAIGGNSVVNITGDEVAKLAACASSPKLAFAPGTGNGELSATFKSIFETIKDSAIRLTQ